MTSHFEVGEQFGRIDDAGKQLLQRRLVPIGHADAGEMRHDTVSA